ncbi:hypothetical protein [Archaeoglobus sp.]
MLSKLSDKILTLIGLAFAFGLAFWLVLEDRAKFMTCGAIVCNL